MSSDGGLIAAQLTHVAVHLEGQLLEVGGGEHTEGALGDQGVALRDVSGLIE